MRNAIARPLAVASFVLAAVFPMHAEDYQCTDDSGCTARITEDGELKEVSFRKGDLVSTEGGWVVNTEDGWVKVKAKGRAH